MTSFNRSFFILTAVFFLYPTTFLAATPQKLPVDFGGTNPLLWRPEAVLANAVSEALNDFWHGANSDQIADVIVSVPLSFKTSRFHPYGDGQSNAAVSFNDWYQQKTTSPSFADGAFRPPLISVLVTLKSGDQKIYFKFDKRFPKGPKDRIGFEIRYRSSEGKIVVEKIQAMPVDGHLIGVWQDIPASLKLLTPANKSAFLVKPIDDLEDHNQTFNDVFPVSFRIPVGKAEDIAEKLPAPRACGKVVDCMNLKKIAEEDALMSIHWLDVDSEDPELGDLKSALLAKVETLIAFHQLDGHDQTVLSQLRKKYYNLLNDGQRTVLKKALFFTDSWKDLFNIERGGVPYMPLIIHGRFPTDQGDLLTSTGMGWTWVFDGESDYKTIYTCFDRRQKDKEALANHGTGSIFNEGRSVVSGAGWHRIGDSQETIVNSLENVPIVVSAGFSLPTERFQHLKPYPHENYSYGLSDVAVARFLFPGEGFVTYEVGGFDGSEDKPELNNFHWYFIDHSQEVCTEEWIHVAGQKAPDLLGEGH